VCSYTLSGVPLVIAETKPLDDRGYDAFCQQAGQAAALTNVGNATLVATVVRCVAERWWELQQTSSPEHWCRVILGVSPSTARQLVRVAREIVDYPKVSVAFCEGRMTLDQVEVIVTRAHPMYDSTLVDAGRWDVHRMRRIIDNFEHPKPQPEPEPADPDDPTPEPAPLPRDDWRAGWSGDGRYRGGFDLGPELGGLLEKAMGTARGALFTARTSVDDNDDDRTQEPSLFTAVDALQRMLHAALDGLDPKIAKGARPGDRTQVVIHIDADNPDGARVHLGPLLPVSVRRQLTCDADLRAVLEVKGIPVETWRRQRVVNQVLRMLIEDRDQGCVIDGCDRKGFLHIHHLWHWEDGGPTIPSNLCALCPEHHRMVHEGRLILVGDPTKPGSLITLDRWRRPLPQPGPLPPSIIPAPQAPYPATLWGGRLRLN
jgi:hypothetical protein